MQNDGENSERACALPVPYMYCTLPSRCEIIYTHIIASSDNAKLRLLCSLVLQYNQRNSFYGYSSKYAGAREGGKRTSGAAFLIAVLVRHVFVVIAVGKYEVALLKKPWASGCGTWE